MTQTLDSPNPQILTWARETAGLSLEEGAHAIQLEGAHGKLGAERLAELEAGQAAPSRSLLERMAKAYRRSLLVFYLDKPPRKGDRGKDFRLTPDAVATAYDADLDVLIRDLKARQSIVRSVLEDLEAEPVSFVGSAARFGRMPSSESLAQTITHTIGFSLSAFRSASSVDTAFAYLRSRIESSGVFVLLAGNLGSHHTSIAPERFRGFAIADELAPFVVINDQDARSAWSFTAIHELAHIWLGDTGLSGPPWLNATEQYCNEVASEVLLPRSEIAELAGIDPRSKIAQAKTAISEFADERNVSRSMVAYRLYLAGLIDSQAWIELRTFFREEWLAAKKRKSEKAKESDGGANYYVVRRHRLGFGLTEVIRQALGSGILTYTKAARVLAVKARNVDQLLQTKVGA